MIFDIMFIVCLTLMIIRGRKKGLVKMGSKLFSVLTALIVTALFGDTIKEKISGTDFYLKIYDSVIQKLSLKITNENDGFASTIVKSATSGIADKIMDILLSVAMFVLVLVAVKVLFFLLGKIVKAPIIKTFDKAGGILCGAAMTVIVFYFAYSVIGTYAVFADNEFLQKQKEQSYAINIISDDRLIEKIFTEGENNE